MEIIDALGKPCPIPVVEAKKALSKKGADCVVIKIDNIVAVQNLEKMAKGYGYSFSYIEKDKNLYEASIALDGNAIPVQSPHANEAQAASNVCVGLVVVIGRNTMGSGAEELGKILIKGFIYSLTELPIPPKYVIFLNSGAYLTAEGSNTIDDLQKLEDNGCEVLTCGTCVNYYGLPKNPAVGAITDMYGITEKMSAGYNVINI